MPVDFMPTRTPPIDDPEIESAMAVYDGLPATEQREIFRSLYRAVTAAFRTQEAGHLIEFAESVEVMVQTESSSPGSLAEFRAAPQTVAEAGGSVPVEEALKMLRGERDGG